jgi:hypothetical protein
MHCAYSPSRWHAHSLGAASVGENKETTTKQKNIRPESREPARGRGDERGRDAAARGAAGRDDIAAVETRGGGVRVRRRRLRLRRRGASSDVTLLDWREEISTEVT